MTKFSAVLLGWAVLFGSGDFSAASPAASNLQARLFSSRNEFTDPALPLQTNQADVLQGSDTAASSSSLSMTVETAGGGKISRGGAMLRSLLVPGWGESYLGHHGTARAFFWTDVAIWATVIGLEVYSQWRRDQFISFGAVHAGADMSGKADQFYADIGNYNSTEEYNEAKLRNRDYEALYTDPSYFWAWDNAQNRLDYDHIRIQSGAAHNKIFFFIGAAALNRLISVVDAGKKANDFLKKADSTNLGFQIQPDRNTPAESVRLVFTAQF